MKNLIQQLEIETFSAQREWTVDGIPVLQADISLPCPVSLRFPARRNVQWQYY